MYQEQEDDIHDHCRSCYDRFCQFDIVKDVSCEIIPCENECGARLHLCKLQDHENICGEVLSSCINAQYGCPFMIKKKDIAAHLLKCPANVMICSIEWNRWLYGNSENDKDYLKDITKKFFNIEVADKNIDVAFALRDQNLLIKRTFSAETLKFISDNCICSERRKIIQRRQNNWNYKLSEFVDVAIEKKLNLFAINKVLQYTEKDFYSILELLNHMVDRVVEVETAQKSSSVGQDPTKTSSENKDTISPGVAEDESKENQVQNGEPSSYKSLGDKLRSYYWNHGLATWRKKSFEDKCVGTDKVDPEPLLFLSPEANPKVSDCIEIIFSLIGVGCRDTPSVLDQSAAQYFVDSSSQTDAAAFGLIKEKVPIISKEKENTSHNKRNEILDTTSSCFLDDKLVNGHEESPSSCNEFSPKILYENLCLDILVDNVPRYQKKRRSMHTFICNCLLRRSEFTSHVKNVHCDIIYGLSDWLEERCPYAQFGCRYSQRKICPNSEGSYVVFDQSQDSFAIRPYYSQLLDKMGERGIFHLPSEIHEVILAYLDSLSMSSMSKTCTYFYDLCNQAKYRQGIVTFDWFKKIYVEGNTSWKMGEKRWQYSGGFHEIRKWVFSKNPLMCNHLLNCKVAKRCTKNAEKLDKKVKILATS